MIPENVSSQKYQKLWPLTCVSKRCIALKQYVTIFWSFYVYNRITPSSNGMTLTNMFSMKIHPVISLLDTSATPGVCFDDICHGGRMHYGVTTIQILLRYQLIPPFLSKHAVSIAWINNGGFNLRKTRWWMILDVFPSRDCAEFGSGASEINTQIDEVQNITLV